MAKNIFPKILNVKVFIARVSINKFMRCQRHMLIILLRVANKLYIFFLLCVKKEALKEVMNIIDERVMTRWNREKYEINFHIYGDLKILNWNWFIEVWNYKVRCSDLLNLSRFRIIIWISKQLCHHLQKNFFMSLPNIIKWLFTVMHGEVKELLSIMLKECVLSTINFLCVFFLYI